MSEVGQQQSPEDLSKLKGPSWWWVILAWLAVMIAGTVIGRLFLVYDPRENVSATEIVMLVISAGIFSASLWAWGIHNINGHTVRWWKDGDRLRVTALKYPTTAKGLVIEVQVKARPSFKLRWGSNGWCEDQQDGSHYIGFVSCSGSRLALPDDRDALIAAGLTQEVIDFLANAHRTWKIIPLDAGRVLRFVDKRECGIEVRYTCLDGVDLEEILHSKDCADYHKRMQEKARIHDIATAQACEAMVKLGLPAPSDALPLVHRLGKVEDVGVQVREARDQAWSQLIWCLGMFRADVGRQGGRPKSKVFALGRVREALAYLHRNLPPDSPLREQYNISAAELRKVDAEITAFDPALTQPPAVRLGGVGTEV